VGLDIGTTAVRAAEVSVGGDSATLHRFGQVALPDGAVRDGEIVDGAAVSDAIRQLWKQVRFGSKQVVIGVANQRLVVRQVELPWLPEKELRKSLGFLSTRRFWTSIPSKSSPLTMGAGCFESYWSPPGKTW